MRNEFEPAGGEFLFGIVEEIVFQNVENGFTVLAVSVDGELVSAVGTLPELSPGEELSLRGRWDEHNLFGRQFKIEEFERRMPETTAGLLKYLSSGAIKGIGPKTAVRIIERFGDNTFHVLEQEPERLAVITGISREKAVQISNEYNKQAAIRNVMISLERYGIRPMECIAVFKRYGSSAVDIINENPYVLCSAVDSIGFERAEKIAERLPNAPNPRHRLRAGVLHVLRHNAHNGHTCVPRQKLYAPCRELLAASEDEVETVLEGLLADKMLVQHEIAGTDFIFLPDMYLHEKNIAERMHSMMNFPPREIPTLEKDIDLLEQLDGIQYESLQRQAIRTAVQKGMLILTGGPGTGKTTTVKGIIRLFERQKLEIVLAAPTGRAAKRLSDVTGMEAKTIHRLLEVAWDDSDHPTFKRDMQNPLTCDVVILDELSMVDVYLFSSLLNALQFGCRVILVGDSDQLPPVGAGNVLLDLIKSQTIPTVCLTEIFRQARESLIVMNAHEIIAGTQPELHKRDGDFFFMERPNPVHAAKTLVELCTERLPSAYGYSPITDIQVLCPSRKGDCGTVNLNRALQACLNPPAKEKGEHRAGSRVFRQGDKVMQIKNNYDILWEKGRESGVGIFNGDVGIIRELDNKAHRMVIDFDERITDYPIENIAELELAYAVTVHKSQGSEFEVVVMPVSDAPPQLLYRNLLYTAVTRAKKLMVLVGNPKKLDIMIENNRKNLRYSALYSFLTEK